MAFSFGQSPAPAPGGNAPAPSFTFGSMAANTPAPGTTSFGEAPAPATGASAGPSFGSSTNTTTGNTAAPTATAGFGSTGTTFGSSNNNNDKATPNTSASTGVSFGAPASSGQDNKAPAAPAFGAATGNSGNAPATSGFGFAGGDNKTSNAQAPAPAGGFYGTSSGAPAPSSTNAFGASNPAPAPTGGLSFAGTAGNTTAFGAPNPAPAPATPQGLKVDAFQDIFPNIAIHDKVKYLLENSASATEEGRERASELIELLRCDSSNETKSIGRTLVAPKALQYTGPDNNVRNQLQTNPQVVLAGDREATLLPEMLREVARIADDLRISEKEALSLYAEVNNPATIPMLEARLEESIIDQTKRMSQDVAAGGFSRVNLGTNAVKAAKELYFFERQRLLRTILVLVQSRIEAPQHPWGPLITRATDNLLQNDLVTKLVQLVRDWSNIIKNIESELARRESAEANSPGEGPEKEKKFYFDQVHLAFALKERQTAAECLYFIAYHTQCTASEVALLIDIVRDLTNSNKDRLILLDPFKDVPSPYEDRPESQQAWAPHFQSSLPPLKERGHLEWERELVKKTWKTTKPQLLNCVSTLVMTIIAALDAKQVLYDRLTHQENSIGMVSLCVTSKRFRRIK